MIQDENIILSLIEGLYKIISIVLPKTLPSHLL